MEIEVTRAALARMLLEARQALPEEACGLLLGQGRLVEGVQSARNVHPTPNTYFEIDPLALIDAHRDARAGGPELLGYYHSHPAGLAEPSATDRGQASGDGRIWAIVAGNDVTFWRDDDPGFVKLSYILVDR